MIQLRIVLILLGLVWGWLVFSVHHTIGYDKAFGYPETGESFRWALGLTTPFMFAAIFAGSGGGIERVLRWLCVLPWVPKSSCWESRGCRCI